MMLRRRSPIQHGGGFDQGWVRTARTTAFFTTKARSARRRWCGGRSLFGSGRFGRSDVSEQLTTHTVDEPDFVEIQQQARSEPAELEVGQKLGFVYRVKDIYRLDLEHKGLFDDHVHREIAIEMVLLVDDGQCLLPDERHPGLGEFMAKAGFVDGFDQPGTQGPVYLYRAPDHAPRIRI
jgi:hypothetical protein